MKTKGKIILYLSIVMFILSLSTVLFAEGFKDVRGVKLNDGTVIYGKVIESNVFKIIIEKKDGKIVPVKFDDVSYFLKDEDAESYQKVDKSAYPVQGDVRQETPTPLSARTGVYMGVFGGFVVPMDMEAEEDGDDRGETELDNSWTIGIKGGYIIPQVKWLALELEYLYLAKQKFDISESFTVFDTYIKYSDYGDYSAHNLMANMLFRYPQGKIHPYGGFGLGISRATFTEDRKREEDGLVVASSSYDEDDTGFAGQLIVGVNFEIMPNLSADLAYRFFYTKYELNDINLEGKNHLFTIGINFHF